MNCDERPEIVIPKGKGKNCPCFVVFLRILLKYLQTRGDHKSYEALRRKVQVCTERAQRKEPGYECVAKSVLQEIPHVVKAADLVRVQAILRARVEQKKRCKHNGKMPADDNNAPTARCEQFDIFNQKPTCSGKTSADATAPPSDCDQLDAFKQMSTDSGKTPADDSTRTSNCDQFDLIQRTSTGSTCGGL